MKSIKYRYLAIYILSKLLILSFINHDQTLTDTLFFLPRHIIFFSFSSILIISVNLFYIYNLLDYIRMDKEIRLRVHSYYSSLIFKRVLVCFVSVLIADILIFLGFDGRQDLIMLVIVSSILSVTVLMFLIVLLREKQFQYILVLTYLANLAVRIALQFLFAV